MMSHLFRSIEINLDNSVTFRVRAPQAEEAWLVGDILTLQTVNEPELHSPRDGAPLHIVMDRDEAGVFSTRISGLKPGYYSYGFIVDGSPTLDSHNKPPLEDECSHNSYLMLPGAGTAFMEELNGPKGDLVVHTYHSSITYNQRRAVVYTPPSYNSQHPYPILVLQHGGGDSEFSWVNAGRANIILDNLINRGKAVPMIVVMPDGFVDYDRSFRPAASKGVRSLISPQAKYPLEIIENLLPDLAQHYSLNLSPESTAMAGLSMGGLDTLSMFFFGRQRFGYYGVFSGGLLPPMIAAMKKKYSDWLQQPVLNEKKCLWLACGGSDIAYQNTLNTLKLLQSNQIEYEFRQNAYTWTHSWHSWQHNLYEFAQKLFK